MVGSYNKLTGINGLRVGWLATNDLNLYSKAYEYVTHDLCGATASGQWAVQKILKEVDLKQFYKESVFMLDDNKTELQRLDKIFSNQPIPKIGMFALWESDVRINSLLDRAGVKFMDGSSVGASPSSWRINLANTPSQTRDMVKDILALDRRKNK
jgi:aspartate/methionine/tyrosine aminotransferase